MSDGARRLMVEEFFHCYRLAEVSQSKGMYNFMPRSPLLRLICKNFDSNRDWKSCYFFLEGDEWMCHPNDNEFMPVDKTWGIMPPSGMRPSTIFIFFSTFLHHLIIRLLMQLETVLQFLLNNLAFWRRFLTKPSLKRRRGLNWSIWIPCTSIVTD